MTIGPRERSWPPSPPWRAVEPRRDDAPAAVGRPRPARAAPEPTSMDLRDICMALSSCTGSANAPTLLRMPRAPPRPWSDRDRAASLRPKDVRAAPVAGMGPAPWPRERRGVQPLGEADRMHVRCLASSALGVALALTFAATAAAGGGGADSGAWGAGHGYGHDRHGPGHIVVIYEENHSFDNLYGGWEGVNGLADADPAHTTQVNQSGAPFTCLPQRDVNLTAPDPLPVTCHDATTATPFDSHFPNAPFAIDDYIAPTDTTCPAPGASAPDGVKKGTGLPGGCTRDLVHRFYNEQFQLDGGKQDRYTLGSDAQGLTQGTYDTRKLPIYQYLHSHHHPPYAIEDSFFQAAFGGSFLNHQWLVAAATPVYANAVQDGSANDLHSKVDSNGMPTKTDFYTPTGPVVDARLTSKCEGLGKPGLLCGDYAVNTIQPWDQPYQPGTPDPNRLPPLTNPTIGDRLSDKGVDWAWYSGGWSNANGDVNAPGWTNGSGPTCSDPATLSNATFPNCPDKLFQFHHQPLAYFKSFAPGTQMRAQHLRDEQEFLGLANGSRPERQLQARSVLQA